MLIKGPCCIDTHIIVELLNETQVAVVSIIRSPISFRTASFRCCDILNPYVSEAVEWLNRYSILWYLQYLSFVTTSTKWTNETKPRSTAHTGLPSTPWLVCIHDWSASEPLIEFFLSPSTPPSDVITITSQWAPWRLKSPASRLFLYYSVDGLYVNQFMILSTSIWSVVVLLCTVMR